MVFGSGFPKAITDLMEIKHKFTSKNKTLLTETIELKTQRAFIFSALENKYIDGVSGFRKSIKYTGPFNHTFAFVSPNCSSVCFDT